MLMDTVEQPCFQRQYLEGLEFLEIIIVHVYFSIIHFILFIKVLQHKC